MDNAHVFFAPIDSDDSDFFYCKSATYRWGLAPLPGMWIVVLNFGAHWAHAHCVVDDFGTLVPVSMAHSHGIEVNP